MLILVESRFVTLPIRSFQSIYWTDRSDRQSISLDFKHESGPNQVRSGLGLDNPDPIVDWYGAGRSVFCMYTAIFWHYTGSYIVFKLQTL